MEQQHGFEIDGALTDVLVTVFSEDLLASSFSLADELRQQGLNVEVFPDTSTKLAKQFDYANKLGIPYALVVGPDEFENDEVAIKNLQESEQKVVSRRDVVETLETMMTS